MQHTRSLTVLALAAGFITLALPGLAGPAPYILKQQPLAKSHGKPDPAGPVKMTLVKAGQAKPLWSFTGADPQNITWAGNGRAVAFWFQPHEASDPPSNIDILVWREGSKVADFHSDDFNEYDAIWGFVWSPDNKLLAFRTGAAGSEMNDGGTLYVYDLAKNRLITGPEEEVRKAQWIDSHTIQYWPLNDHTGVTKDGKPFGSWDLGQPKLWHMQ